MRDNDEYTILDQYRFERKFIGNSFDAHNSELIIKMNPSGFREIYSERFINNVYFDTDRFDFYYDNVNGRHDRIKFRIRWYGDLYRKVENPILELKIKQGQVGTKESFELIGFDFSKDFNFNDFDTIFRESNLPLHVSLALQNLRASLVNRYKRKYFRDFSANFRITIDKEIEYFPVNQISFGKIFHKDFKNHIIELKYDNDKDEIADLITRYLPFRMTKNSKYANGIELFNYVID